MKEKQDMIEKHRIIHDFNNIFIKVITSIQIAKQNKDDDKKIEKYLSYAEQGAVELGNYFYNVIDSVIGQEQEEKISCNIVQLILEEINFQVAGSEKIVFNYDSSVETCMLTIKKFQIRRVFKNLVHNALQAMSNGGLLSLAIALNETENTVTITLKDSGIGINPENLPHVFEPYFSTKAGSSGIGLSICRSVIEQHGGTIEVESEIGRGTTFTIVLPTLDKKRN